VFAVAGGLAALAVVLVIVISSRGGDGEGDRSDGGGLGGAAAGTVPGGSTVPSNAGTVTPTTTGGEGGDRGDGPDGGEGEGAPAGAGLPAVTIPSESAAPTTIPGSEPNSIPVDIFSGEEAPQFGTLVVDLEEGGYADFAVHLRTDQAIQLLSLADDGIGTEIEVYAPDGSKEGWWKGGEPGVVNGLEWHLPDEPPAGHRHLRDQGDPHRRQPRAVRPRLLRQGVRVRRARPTGGGPVHKGRRIR
jgi:hypothetical protein